MDVVEDLDGPAPPGVVAAPGPAPGGPGREPGRRRGRRPLVIAAASVAAAVAVGGVAHAVAVERAQRRLDLAVASLAVSIPAGASGPVGTPDAGGWSAYRVSVPVFSRDPGAAAVTVLGLDTAHQRTRRAAPSVHVAAGAPATADLELDVRCRGVPAPGAPATGRAARMVVRTAVRARVEVPGTSRVVRLTPSPGLHDADPFVQQLWLACAYAGQLPADQVAGSGPLSGALPPGTTSGPPGGVFGGGSLVQ